MHATYDAEIKPNLKSLVPGQHQLALLWQASCHFHTHDWCVGACPKAPEGALNSTAYKSIHSLLCTKLFTVACPVLASHTGLLLVALD